MSLSKYYKSSNSFQPEEIIKKAPVVQPGWQALQEHDQRAFTSQRQPGRVEEEQNPNQSVNLQPVDADPTQEPGEKDILTESLTNDENTTKTTPAPSKDDLQNDLTDVMPLVEAEEKIETAYSLGIKEGIEKADNDFGAATRALLNACQQLETLRETLITNSGAELQKFALTIAERIIRSSLHEQKNTVIATIEEALQRAVKSDEFYIYINPDDYATVIERSDEFIAGVSGLNNVVIKKDSTIERGGAKIESENCTIDATVASQFEMIRDSIQKSIAS